MLGRNRRLAILAEASFTPRDAKTAVGVLRYRAPDVVAVLDSTRAGRTAQQCAGVGGDVPVVSRVVEAAALGADTLMIGIAPQGGGLPDAWRSAISDALGRGWDVLSGLHVFLGDDPEFASAARRSGAKIHDVRRPPASRPVGSAAAGALESLVVLTVGSDCNVGKMTTAIEIHRELLRRSIRSRFVATGQTGIFIADHGAAVDAVPSDFVAGITESLVLEAARGDGEPVEVVMVEGQGSLHHPGYSGVTLGLLHGACPACLVLCHEPTRDRMRLGSSNHGPSIPSLRELAAAYRAAASWVRPASVIGVALNTMAMDAEAARAACEAARAELEVPATDPVRFGAEPLARAVEERRSVRSAATAAETRRFTER
jgi:uncharacterized NAD-dependent epimerase/dehydratase family protein